MGAGVGGRGVSSPILLTSFPPLQVVEAGVSGEKVLGT